MVGLHSNDFKRMSTFALQVKKLITSHISCGTPTNGSQCVLIFVYSVQVQSKFLESQCVLRPDGVLQKYFFCTFRIQCGR